MMEIRAASIAKLSKEQFDLLVIGGGVTGAGIALDASLRGLKVALVEKSDFASGTSSKSTKLIHGGLRYLKQLNFKLVRESGKERAIVHKIANHLCIPQRMILPIIPDGSLGYITTALALSVYDKLASVSKGDKKKMLSAKEALEIEPALSGFELKGAGFYTEYRTDDARLTIELIKSAIRNGCTSVNYVRAELFQQNIQGHLEGVKVIDELNQQSFYISAKKIVSATGPWVDDLRKLDNVKVSGKLKLSKGIHLVFANDKLPVNHPIYFDTFDKRMIFAIPRGKVTYVGTTDTEFFGDSNDLIITEKDRDYLLKCINESFPQFHVSSKDILSSWAGLRPLIYKEGKSTKELSRKDEIFHSQSGLLSIAGGKLTGYRRMAQRVVDVITQDKAFFNRSFTKCLTADYFLLEKPFTTDTEIIDYKNNLNAKFKEQAIVIEYLEYLISNYGRQTDDILSRLDFTSKDVTVKQMLLAELDFCIENEFVQRATDFFLRRSGRMYFLIESVLENKEIVLSAMQNHFNWSNERYISEVELLEREILRCKTFRSIK